MKNVSFCRPTPIYDEQSVRLVYRRKQSKKKNNAEKWASQLVFTKQLMLLAVGKKRLGPKPISRPPQPLYGVDVAGFSLCQERTYSNVYGY